MSDMSRNIADNVSDLNNDDYVGLAEEADRTQEEEPVKPNTPSACVLHNAWTDQVVAWTVHHDQDVLDDWEQEHSGDDPRAEMFSADLVLADDVDPTAQNPALFVEFFGTAAVLVAADRKTLWSMRDQWVAEHGDPDDPRHALTRQSEFRIQLEQRPDGEAFGWAVLVRDVDEDEMYD